MMKKFYLFIIFSFIGIGFAFAQNQDGKPNGKMMKEVQEFKMKYLAQEMELKGDQKKKFIELYEEMNKERRECYKEARALNKKVKSSEDATEEDYQHVTDAMTAANVKAAEIEKRYDEKFSEFLTPKQIYKMKEAENVFRQKMEEMKLNNKKNKKHATKHK